MHKLFTLIIVLFFTSLTVNAQNSKDEYDKAVDYCACKMAYVYTEDYSSKNPTSDEKKSFDEVISNQLNDCDKKNISSSNLEKLLKENNFNDFAIKLKLAIKESKNVGVDSIDKQQAIDNILNGFYSNEGFSKIVLKYSTVKELKSSLETDLNNILISFNEQTSSVDNETIKKTASNAISETNHSNSIINREDNNQSESTFFPNWLLFVLILLAFIILFIYNYLSNKKLNERIDRRLSKNEYQETIKSSTPSNNSNRTNSRFEKDTLKNIEEINEAIRRLQMASPPSDLASSSSKNKVEKINLESVPKEPQKFLFAKTPISDKVFNAADVTEDKEGKFYKFLIQNDNQAEFEFFNNENSAKRALNAPDDFLYPVCERIENLNQHAQRIITQKPGIALKQDDKWIVKEKAQITYE